jgi:hypothetical protein
MFQMSLRSMLLVPWHFYIGAAVASSVSLSSAQSDMWTSRTRVLVPE